MKSLKESLNESNELLNEGVITVGATIWAIGQLVGLILGGVAITGSIISALISANKSKKEFNEDVNKLNSLLEPYKESLFNPEICPAWSKIFKGDIKDFNSNLDLLKTDIWDEAKNIMSNDDYSYFCRLARHIGLSQRNLK